jgi:hypothetical protein
MRIPYFEAAPPHAINAVEFPDDEEEAERSWIKWPLSADLRGRPLRTQLVGTVFPLAIHHARPGLWLLETQDRADPRAVIKDPDDLLFALDQDAAKGPPVYHHFQLAERYALEYILMAGYPLPDEISLPQPAATDPPTTATLPAGSDGAGPTADRPEENSADDGPTSAPPGTNAARPVRLREGEEDEGKSTYARIKAELERDPLAKSEEIADRVERKPQTVRRNKAWREHQKRQERQKPKSTDASDHSIPLTDEMLAVIPSRSKGPADIVADREELDHSEAIDPTEVRRRRFLETATRDDKARLLGLPPAEQERELEAWDLTGEFLPDEPPGPGPLRQRLAGRRSV